jgi:hypothetical protein
MPSTKAHLWLLAAFAGCGPTTTEATPTEASPNVAVDGTPASALPPSEGAEGALTMEGSGAGEGSASGEASGETSAPGESSGEPPQVIEEAEVAPPDDYGQIKLALPPPAPEALTHYGLAGYEVVAVYSKPELSSAKLGYLRIGTRLRVTDKLGEADDCKKGFYGLPMGGFVCANKGFVVEATKPPFMKYEVPAPRLDLAHPYPYGYVRRWNSPMWWRVPTDEELRAAELQRAQREAERTGTPLALPTVEDDVDAPPPPPPEPIKLPISPATPWLERGFFLSLGEKVKEGSRSFYRTARGAFVDVADVFTYDAKDFQGIELSGEVSFPVAIVKKETKLLQLGDDDKLKAIKSLERRDFLDVDEEVEIAGKAYMMTADGHLVRKEHLTIPTLQELPKGLDPWERWIDVSVSQQLLVAYEGARPVYVTLVSTGKKGTKEEPFETPTGRWRIYSKHVSTTMDGNTASDGNYSIQDVPWTMFFFGSYALHGAFWHRSFGNTRSHGCVNLGPSDARWLFFWTTPFLPEGWHGVHATDESPGTTVIIRP